MVSALSLEVFILRVILATCLDFFLNRLGDRRSSSSSGSVALPRLLVAGPPSPPVVSLLHFPPTASELLCWWRVLKELFSNPSSCLGSVFLFSHLVPRISLFSHRWCDPIPSPLFLPSPMTRSRVFMVRVPSSTPSHPGFLFRHIHDPFHLPLGRIFTLSSTDL